MKNFKLPYLTLILLFFSNQLFSQCLYEQELGDDTIAFTSDFSSQYHCFDDFNVPAGETWNISRVFVTMITQPTSITPGFDVSILTDPTTTFDSREVLPSEVNSTVISTLASGKIMYEFELILNMPIIISGGISGTDYYLKVFSYNDDPLTEYKWVVDNEPLNNYGLNGYVYDYWNNQLYTNNSDFVFKIHHGTYSVIQEDACDSYTWIDGNTYTNDGQIYHTLFNASANGCDSIIKLELNINESTNSTDIKYACGSYTWIDGNTYTASNNAATYTLSGGNLNGCDSIIHLNLTIYPYPTATIVNNGSGQLIASSGSSYSWINCSTNQIIVGETSNSFTVTTNGQYAVIITNSNNCSDTSDCITISDLGINESNLNTLNLYPNPAKSTLMIQGIESVFNYKIFESSGKILLVGNVSNDNTIDISTINSGIYTIQLTSNEGVKNLRFIKE